MSRLRLRFFAFFAVLLLFGYFTALSDGLNLWSDSVYGGGTGIQAAPSFPTYTTAKKFKVYTQSLTPLSFLQKMHFRRAQQEGRYGQGETIGLFETDADFSMPAYLAFCKAFASEEPELMYPNHVSIWTDGQLHALSRSSQVIRPNSEALLDAEWAHVVAPRANLLLIDIHQSGVPYPLTLARLKQLLHNAHVNVLSSSVEQGIQPLMSHNPLLQERTFGSRAMLLWTASHYPLFLASGDQPGHVSSATIAPQAVFVGASQFVGKSLEPTPWEGQGPAVWTAFASPLQRQAAGRPLLYRQVPDVVWFGGNPGVFISDTRGFLGGVEGTSLASPTFAALFALADAAHVAQTGHPLPANANRLLYELALKHPHAFNRGVKNRPLWQPYQGLGNPNPALFVKDLSKWPAHALAKSRVSLHLALWPFVFSIATTVFILGVWFYRVVRYGLRLEDLNDIYPQMKSRLWLRFLTGAVTLPLVLFALRYALLWYSLNISGTLVYRVVSFSLFDVACAAVLSGSTYVWLRTLRLIAALTMHSDPTQGEHKQT